MNIYETVTTRILNQLEAGQVPWRKTWQTGLPKSLSTGKEYRGLNLLVLGGTEYTSRYWLTYRQAEHLGGHVRQGEHATTVVYWKWRTAAELEQRRQQTGQENAAPCHPFTASVFNLDQVDGIARPEDDVLNPTNRRLEIAEQMLGVMPDKPEIVHTMTSSPAYCPALDRITLPHLSQFESAEHFYCVLWHELVHATGARKRLHRFDDAQRDQPEKYSFEEYAVREKCCASSATKPLAEVRAVSWQHNSCNISVLRVFTVHGPINPIAQSSRNEPASGNTSVDSQWTQTKYGRCLPPVDPSLSEILRGTEIEGVTAP